MRTFPTRRGFLKASATAGTSLLAGCSVISVERSERKTLQELVQTQVPTLPRGVTVAGQHIKYWRNRYVRTAEKLATFIDRVENESVEEVDNSTLSAPDVQRTLNDIETSPTYRDEWEKVEYLRTLTLSAQTQLTVLKYHTGEFTVTTLKTLTTNLVRRLENAYQLLEYDRGGFDRGLVQLTRAEDVLDQAIRRKDVYDTVRNADLTDNLVYNAIRSIFEARTRLKDVEYLMRALPHITSHISRLTTLYEALYPRADTRITALQTQDQYYGYNLYELTYELSPSALLKGELPLSAVRAHKRDYYASAVMFILRALVMAAGVTALNNLSGRDVNALDLATLTKQAKQANHAFLAVFENASALVELSLLRLVYKPLNAANVQVREQLETDTISVSELKRAYLQYVISEESTQSINRWTRRVYQL